jgi:putative peptidoglycan lipid II flippase
LVPGYFARQDTKTPVRIAIVCLTVNVALNLILMGPLGHVGIALATSLSGWLNAALLARGLHRRGFFTADQRLRQRIPRMLVATAAMAAALWAVSSALAGPLGASLGTGVGSLLALMFTGILVYGLVARAVGAAYVADLRNFWRSRDSEPGSKDGAA